MFPLSLVKEKEERDEMRDERKAKEMRERDVLFLKEQDISYSTLLYPYANKWMGILKSTLKVCDITLPCNSFSPSKGKFCKAQITILLKKITHGMDCVDVSVNLIPLQRAWISLSQGWLS